MTYGSQYLPPPPCVNSVLAASPGPVMLHVMLPMSAAQSGCSGKAIVSIAHMLLAGVCMRTAGLIMAVGTEALPVSQTKDASILGFPSKSADQEAMAVPCHRGAVISFRQGDRCYR